MPHPPPASWESNSLPTLSRPPRFQWAESGEIALLPFSLGGCRIVNLCSLYRGPCRQLVGITPGARKRAYVNKALHAMGLKKIGKRLNGMRGMADGENKVGGFGEGMAPCILPWIMRERAFLLGGHGAVLPSKKRQSLAQPLPLVGPRGHGAVLGAGGTGAMSPIARWHFNPRGKMLSCGACAYLTTPSIFFSGKALRTAARSCLAEGSLPFMAGGSFDRSS